MKNSRKKFIISLLVLIVFLGLSLFFVKNKLTYLECTTMNENGDASIAVDCSGEKLVQEFVMPYDIMQGFSLKIGTYARDNNQNGVLK